MIKNNKAITLIALIITIIVLLVLAAVTINMVLGENGLINKTKTSVAKYENAQLDEQKELSELYSRLMIATNDDAQVTISVKDLKTLINEQVREILTTDEYQTKSDVNTEIKNALTTEDITSSLHLNTTYFSPRGNVRLTKNGNTVILTAYINVIANVPATTDNFINIFTVDSPYRAKFSIVYSYIMNTTNNKFLNILSNGNICINHSLSSGSVLSINASWQV